MTLTFINTGNSCFFNTTLQLFLSCPAWRDFMIVKLKPTEPLMDHSDFGFDVECAKRILNPQEPKSPCHHPAFAKSSFAFSRMLEFDKCLIAVLGVAYEMYHLALKKHPGFELSSSVGPSPVTPIMLRRHLNRVYKTFNNTDQHDADACYLAILDILECAAWLFSVQRNDDSVLTKFQKLFYGKLCYRMTCQSCQHSKTLDDRIASLHLSSPQFTNVLENLVASYGDETLDIQCESTCSSSHPHLRQTYFEVDSVTDLPRMFVFTVQRTLQGRPSCLIEFPLTLEISDVIYELVYMVVHHGGSLHSGHYTGLNLTESVVYNDQRRHACTIDRHKGIADASIYMVVYTQQLGG